MIRLPANLSVLKFSYLVRFFNSLPCNLLSFNSNYTKDVTLSMHIHIIHIQVLVYYEYTSLLLTLTRLGASGKFWVDLICVWFMDNNSRFVNSSRKALSSAERLSILNSSKIKLLNYTHIKLHLNKSIVPQWGWVPHLRWAFFILNL